MQPPLGRVRSAVVRRERQLRQCVHERLRQHEGEVAIVRHRLRRPRRCARMLRMLRWQCLCTGRHGDERSEPASCRLPGIAYVNSASLLSSMIVHLFGTAASSGGVESHHGPGGLFGVSLRLHTPSPGRCPRQRSMSRVPAGEGARRCRCRCRRSSERRWRRWEQLLRWRQRELGLLFINAHAGLSLVAYAPLILVPCTRSRAER